METIAFKNEYQEKADLASHSVDISVSDIYF